MRRTCLPLVVLIFAWVLACSRPVRAIPAFARREGVSCQMCHFRLPELNEDGHAYLRRGLREERRGAEGGGAMAGMMEPTRTPEAAEERPLGEPLPLEWARYLSVMGHHMYNLERGSHPAFDAGVVDLWVGGPLNPTLSGLANPSFGIQNGGSGVEQAYGQYITRWSTSFGSARFGQVLPFALLFNGAGPQMPLSTPVALSMPGGSGSAWTPDSLVRGAELGYVDLPRWNAYAGVGQPNVEVGESTMSGRRRHFRQGEAMQDANDRRHTDVYASGEYLFTPEGDSLMLFGYWGRAWLSDAAPSEAFHRIGGFANLYLPSTKVTAGYVTGRDKAANGRTLDVPGYFAQAEQLLGSRWAAYGRYDWFRRDLAAGGSERISGPTLGLTWWAQTEVRLTVEGQLLSTTGSPQDRTLMSEFFWVF